MVKVTPELTTYDEALLKKRKRDDADQLRRIDARAKIKLEQGQKKKEEEKIKAAGGVKITLAEVFASNRMKARRGFVHYKRNKHAIARANVLKSKYGDKDAVRRQAAKGKDIVNADMLILAVRIKGNTEGSITPQAEKILKVMGLRNINNAVFCKADAETMERLIIIQRYIAYGYPSKTTVETLVRKRGFLR